MKKIPLLILALCLGLVLGACNPVEQVTSDINKAMIDMNRTVSSILGGDKSAGQSSSSTSTSTAASSDTSSSYASEDSSSYQDYSSSSYSSSTYNEPDYGSSSRSYDSSSYLEPESEPEPAPVRRRRPPRSSAASSEPESDVGPEPMAPPMDGEDPMEM